MGVLGAMERSEWVQLLPGALPVWIKKNGAGEGDQQGWTPSLVSPHPAAPSVSRQKLLAEHRCAIQGPSPRSQS